MTLIEGPRCEFQGNFYGGDAVILLNKDGCHFTWEIAISVYIFNAIQWIKLQIGGNRICCMSIYIHEYYVYKLNRILTMLGFIFCIKEP